MIKIMRNSRVYQINVLLSPWIECGTMQGELFLRMMHHALTIACRSCCLPGRNPAVLTLSLIFSGSCNKSDYSGEFHPFTSLDTHVTQASTPTKKVCHSKCGANLNRKQRQKSNRHFEKSPRVTNLFLSTKDVGRAMIKRCF